jgi:hypothetical protein
MNTKNKWFFESAYQKNKQKFYWNQKKEKDYSYEYNILQKNKEKKDFKKFKNFLIKNFKIFYYSISLPHIKMIFEDISKNTYYINYVLLDINIMIDKENIKKRCLNHIENCEECSANYRKNKIKTVIKNTIKK